MSKYGLPYMGSKAKIAEDIINILPIGKRFVDLFGGGGAMSHCALLSNKYESIYYNELNPLVSNLFKDAINGKYNYNCFKPTFVSREEFKAKKDIDGYTTYIWSFGNIGSAYIFGKIREEFKRQAHNYVIFNDQDGLKYLENHYKDSYYWLIKDIYNKDAKISRNNYTNMILKIEAIRVTKLYSDNVYNEFKNLSYNEFRKLSNKAIIKSINEHIPNIPKKDYKSSKQTKELLELKQLEQLQELQRLEQLQQLERLQQLEQLEQLERLQQLEINTGSYLDYIYQEGDVVYLDPPYENTATYSEDGFNHKEFYDWVYTRPYQVFFSSYEISDNRFYICNKQEKRNLLRSKDNSKVSNEYLYSNRPMAQEPTVKLGLGGIEYKEGKETK